MSQSWEIQTETLPFFFEKKKQKTFVLFACIEARSRTASIDVGSTGARLNASDKDRSFLLLFFKKEGLALPSFLNPLSKPCFPRGFTPSLIVPCGADPQASASGRIWDGYACLMLAWATRIAVVSLGFLWSASAALSPLRRSPAWSCCGVDPTTSRACRWLTRTCPGLFPIATCSSPGGISMATI